MRTEDFLDRSITFLPHRSGHVVKSEVMQSPDEGMPTMEEEPPLPPKDAEELHLVDPGKNNAKHVCVHRRCRSLR